MRRLLVLTLLLVAGLLFAVTWSNGIEDARPELATPRAGDELGALAPTADLSASGSNSRGAPGAPSAARVSAVLDPLAEVGPQAHLRGAVVDAAQGLPVAGASVRLSRPDVLGGDEDALEVLSDAAGRFELSWPEAWAAALAVTHPDYVDQRRPSVEFDAPLRIALVISGSIEGQLSGMTADQGRRSVARLWPTYVGRVRGDAIAEAPLDERGRFRFSDLIEGTYAVGVEVPEAPVVYEPEVIVRGGEPTHLHLTLSPGERLLARVLQRVDRAPVEGVLVHAQPELQGVGGEVEASAARNAITGLDGRFELLGLTPGELELELRTPWGAVIREDHAISPGRTDEPTFLVPAPGSLTGRVVDARGKAVASALVALTVAGEARRYHWARPQELLDQVEDGLRLVHADGQGRFDFGAVAARQELQLAAYPPSGSSAEAFGAFMRKVELAEGETRDVELRLVPTTTIFGRAVDPDGAGVAGVRIEVEIDAGRDRSFLGEVLTDASGQYRVEGVPASRVRVDANLDGHRGDSRWVDLALDASGEVPDLLVEPAFRVRGHVIDEDGWGVPHARVWVREAGSDEERRRGRSETADEYGRFEVTGLQQGDFEVDAWAATHNLPDGREPLVSLPGDPYVVLTLERRVLPMPGSITGELTVAGTGAPVPGIQIRGSRGTVLLDGARFRVTGLPPGPIRLQAHAPGMESVRFDEVSVPEGGSVEIGRYETRPTARVHVVVTDPNGQPLQDARVRLYRLAKQPARGVEVPKGYTLDFDRRRGAYEQEGVGRYDWTLDVRHERYAASSQVIQVRGNRDYQVQLSEPTQKTKGKQNSKGD